jgi:hypothetical protein
MNREELLPTKICKTKLINVTQDEFCELYKHLNNDHWMYKKIIPNILRK